MEKQNWLEIMQGQAQLKQVEETNQYTEQFGLVLSEQDAKLLVAEKNNILKKERRVEFGATVLPQIIRTFCSSPYIRQSNYVDTLIALQELFLVYKNEMQDEITDEELLNFMREQFDTVCYGDLEYLGGTCLEIFAQAIRAGYRDYTYTQGKGEFEQFDLVRRWDRSLYLEALQELCGWR